MSQPKYRNPAQAAANVRKKLLAQRQAIIRAQPRPLIRATQSQVALWSKTQSKGEEKKQVDIPQTVTNFTSNSAGQIINPVQVGAAAYNRIGNKLMGKSIRVFGQIALVATCAVQQVLRVVIVYDKTPGASIPAFQTIFNATDQAGANTAGNSAQLGISFRDRFIVLANKQYVPAAAATLTGAVVSAVSTLDQSFCAAIDIFVPLRNIPSIYTGTANPIVVTNFSTGAIYMYLVATTDNIYGLNFTARHVFKG